MRHVQTKLLVTSLIVAAALVAVGCGDSSSSTDNGGSDDGVKFALIETGPKDDGGYNTNFLRGVEQLPDLVPGTTTQIVDNVNPGSQAQSALETLANQGFEVIAANGNFAKDVTKVAPRYPDVKFLDTYDEELAENKGIYGAADEQGGYLNGILAASASKTGTIGYVGSYPIPQVQRVVDAYALGAQSVDPEITVKTLYVNSYYDPTKEQQAASALADAGADVLMQDNSSPASAQVAEDRGLGYVGWAADRSKQAPNAWLGGFNYNWGPVFAAELEKVADGNWEAEISHPGLKEEGIVLYDFGSRVPEDVQNQVEDAKAAIESGELKVFAGPITDTDGNVVVEDGSAVETPADLNSCCPYYVEGVDAQD